MFSDGIRPGCDLADLDTNWNNANCAPSTSKAAAAALAASIAKQTTSGTGKGAGATATKVQTVQPAAAPPVADKSAGQPVSQLRTPNPNLPPVDGHTRSYIPRSGILLPPICLAATEADASTAAATAVLVGGGGGRGGGVTLQTRYAEVRNDAALIRRLQQGEQLRFALQRNLYVLVRIVTREYGVE